MLSTVTGRVFALCCCAAAMVWRPASMLAQTMPAPLEHFLQDTVDLTSTEMAAVRAGTPIVKVLQSPIRAKSRWSALLGYEYRVPCTYSK
jgi:hypothetical protein